MAYTDIISLQQAKDYLRVDKDLTDDDNQITGMINASLAFVERYTNHILFSRNKEYLFNDCQNVRVYDFPINALVSPTDAERTEKNNYSIYTTNNSSNTKLELTVGYSDSNDIPREIIEFAYNMIELYYYQKETNDSDGVPKWMKSTIDQYKRFIF